MIKRDGKYRDIYSVMVAQDIAFSTDLQTQFPFFFSDIWNGGSKERVERRVILFKDYYKDSVTFPREKSCHQWFSVVFVIQYVFVSNDFICSKRSLTMALVYLNKLNYGVYTMFFREISVFDVNYEKD